MQEKVKSTDFKTWFGNSVVVDKNGLPLKMHHLTDAEFDTFSPEHIKGGSMAMHGLGYNFSRTGFGGYGKNDLVCYLRAEKPLTNRKKTISLNKVYKGIQYVDKFNEYGDSIASEYTGDGVKVGEANYFNNAIKAAQKIYNYAENDLDIYVSFSVTSGNHKAIMDYFRNLGFDSSIEYPNNSDLPSVVVVFDQNQIKSVNNKTFDNDEMSFLKETISISEREISEMVLKCVRNVLSENENRAKEDAIIGINRDFAKKRKSFKKTERPDDNDFSDDAKARKRLRDEEDHYTYERFSPINSDFFDVDPENVIPDI